MNYNFTPNGPLNTAVLFLVFNRPDTTALVFEAIRNVRPTRLYVAADGPRLDRKGEAERCAEVRRIATNIDWDCEVHTLLRDNNLGCKNAVSSGITWFFEHEEAGIVLEDDCLPDPSFFPYCAELLERYRETPEVMCITGNNFQSDMQGWAYSYYFSIFNHCWGWASWRRAWELYDFDLNKYKNTDSKAIMESLSTVPGFADYFIVQLDAVKEGRIDTWDYSWSWTCWLNNGLTCTPKVNLVSNIGFGEEATHTFDVHSPAANLARDEIYLPLEHPTNIEVSHDFDALICHEVFKIKPTKGIWRSIRKVRRFVGSILRILRLK